MNVELLDYMGNDLMVANVARVSYGKEVAEFSDRDVKLIKYLAEHGHTSPFRHPQLQFRVRCPIYVERQLFKHQVGMSANSISGRYVDFSDEYEMPTELRIQSKDSKQGSAGVMDRPDLIQSMTDHIDASKALYKTLCDADVAKEQARIVLPLNLMTTFIWTGSLMAYMHMFKLRTKADAQLETRHLAGTMLGLVQDMGKFDASLKAFNL